MYLKKIIFFVAVFFVSFKLINYKIIDIDKSDEKLVKKISINCPKINSKYNTLNIVYDENLNKKIFKPNLKKGKKILLIMTHGLVLENKTFSIKALKNIEIALNKKYPNSNIEYLYIDFDKSVTISLNKQADIIQNQVKNYIKEKKIDPTINMIIIGHCTGALSGFCFYNKYKDKYNIKGIISSNTPWHGATIIKTRHNHFNNIFKKVLGKRFFYIYSDERDTIKEIIPNSKFMIKQKINLQKLQIPIWAIGSVSSFYKKLSLPSVSRLIMKKNKNEKYLYGSNYNDGLVSLESQIGFFHDKIMPIILNENAIHSIGLKIELLWFVKKMPLIAKFLIKKSDVKGLLSLKDEPSITETNHYLGLIFSFVEKYGIYQDLKYENDHILINNIKGICIDKINGEDNIVVEKV